MTAPQIKKHPISELFVCPTCGHDRILEIWNETLPTDEVVFIDDHGDITYGRLLFETARVPEYVCENCRNNLVNEVGEPVTTPEELLNYLMAQQKERKSE